MTLLNTPSSSSFASSTSFKIIILIRILFRLPLIAGFTTIRPHLQYDYHPKGEDAVQRRHQHQQYYQLPLVSYMNKAVLLSKPEASASHHRSLFMLYQTKSGDTQSSPSSSYSSSYEMPWSTNQEWALQDKISKYTINIPRLNNPTLEGGGINKTTFVLWYTMRNEVTEIMGYDIDYLQMKYAALMDIDDVDIDDENVNNNTPLKLDPPGILPFLDEFEFRSNGGIKGKVYGLVGIEPGTEIVTSPLKDVELTLRKGFVLTNDGSCAYELGIPKSEAKRAMAISDSDGYAMDLSNMKDGGANLVSSVSDQSGRVVSNVAKELGDPETSQMIVNLGTTTAIVLGAATAMNMLSHHLTVNVFWV